MTERLYYDDSYLTEFDAVVTRCDRREDGFHVQLDRSAFYPTSGGQPFDTGEIGAVRVKDVYVGEDHDVWHVLEAPLAEGAAVHGRVDWPRRFDHMQQHAADHMIASALWRLLGGVTIGLHISHDVSTIDVAMPEGVTRIGEEDIRRVENDVNERVQRDVPVRCWFPDAAELAALPLRKPPTVSEHVRVVAIGTDEMVACGGTHPSTAGQLGMVKILGVAPARGKMRVSFVAGTRALNHYRLHYDCATQTANLLSTGVERMATSVAALQAQLKQAEYELTHLRRDILLSQSGEMIAAARRTPDGVAVVARRIEGDANLAKDLAAHLIRTEGVIALIGADAGDGRANLVFARSADVSTPMGQLLSSAAKPLGGKGGGRPDFAQGGGPMEIVDAAADMLLAD